MSRSLYANSAQRPPPKSIGEFIAELQWLRHQASALGMDRVTLCLDYAYWETLSEESPIWRV